MSLFRVGLVGLVKIELPGTTVRLCDGGFVRWDAETFRSHHAVFGTIAAVDAVTEGLTEAVPALDLTLFPAAGAAAEDLSQPGFQRSRVRFWIAEYAPDAGILVGDPELMFDGQIDQTTIAEDAGTREVTIAVVSRLERLMFRNRGNSLNPRFHKSIWPGETGHDQATGLGRQAAWGTELPTPANAAAAFGSGGMGGSGGGRFDFEARFR